jgi:hypothetical protein
LFFFFQNGHTSINLPREVLSTKNWIGLTALTKEQIKIVKEYEEKVFAEDPEMRLGNTPSFIEVCKRTRLPSEFIQHIYEQVIFCFAFL